MDIFLEINLSHLTMVFPAPNLNNKSGQIIKSIEFSFTKSMQSKLFIYLAKPIIYGIGSTQNIPRKKREKKRALHRIIL